MLFRLLSKDAKDSKKKRLSVDDVFLVIAERLKDLLCQEMEVSDKALSRFNYCAPFLAAVAFLIREILLRAQEYSLSQVLSLDIFGVEQPRKRPHRNMRYPLQNLGQNPLHQA